MGLLSRINQLVRRFRGNERRLVDADEYRRCRFETMEPRRLMDADPIRIGAVFIEEDAGADLHGDTFELTFVGGAPGTELTRVEINGDQGAPGFGEGNVFFDTEEGGYGADHAKAFQIVSLHSQNPDASVKASVSDGSSLLVLEFSGFQAGDKLVFSIDVDEVEGFDPAETDLDIINESFDPITSGVEFQSSKLTAYFSAPHYHSTEGTSEFRNRYDDNFAGSGLDLPADNFAGKRDRSDGAILSLQQVPLPISIAGTVYMEKDLDLIQDSGEAGIANVDVSLWQKQGSSYTFTGHSTKTDANGRYEFGTDLNLLPGTYQVRETQPSGLFSVGAIPGTVAGTIAGSTVSGDHNILTEINIPLGGQNSINNNFAEAQPAQISGYVYHDRSNDGVRDSGEEGIGGVSIQIVPVNTIAPQLAVTVQTNSNGFYEATGLAPGTYRIVETTQPANYFDGLDKPGTVNGVPTGTVSNPGDSLEQILLTGGQIGVNYNFGELAPASLQGRVGLTDADGNCDDTNFRAVSDAVVRLLDPTGKLIAETTTDENGEYEFRGLRPGQYSVVELTPQGLIDGDSHAGTVNGAVRGTAGVGTISQIVLGSGENGIRFDFCEHEPSSISGYVYHDENDNGFMEPFEAPIGGTTVSLADELGNIVDTVQTDELGYYEFVGLSAGMYTVVESQPAGWLDGQDTAGDIDGLPTGQAENPGDRISNISLRWGEHSVRNDFGELLPGSITGLVHLDKNGDCILDADEQPLQGVTIQLLDVDGNVIRTTQTDSQGIYTFENLTPGMYGVREIQPNGVFHGDQHAGSHGGDDTLDDLITSIQVGSGQLLVDYNFCELPPASLAGRVFLDPNQDLQFNAGDTELSGVVIELLNEFDEVVATTTTDSLGRYKFENLAPGIYAVRETQPAGYYQGGQIAGTGGGFDFDEDLISEIFISAGQDLLEYNFAELPPASLAGAVYTDPNQDFTFNSGDQRLSGITIELRNENGVVVGTQQTNSEGRYRFENLAPGVYSVREIQPTSYFHGGQIAGSGGGNDFTDDVISEIVVFGGQHLENYDFTELPPSRIAGNVFQDGPAIQRSTENLTPQEIGQLRDGQLTSDDTPLGGVTLQLRDGFTGEAVDASEALPGIYAPGPIEVKTDAQGRYEFVGLPGGRSYAVYEVHPSDYVDGIDTVGTTTGFAFNPQSLDEQIILEPLAGQPASDAIIRIAVGVGQSSENNNFSEVKVEGSLVPPSDPPQPVIFPPPKTYIPDLIQPSISTQTRVAPIQSVTTWITPRQHVTAEAMSGSIGQSWHLSVINGGMPRDLASAVENDHAVWQSATYLDQSNWAADQMQAAKWVLAASIQANQYTGSRSLVFGVRGGTPIAGDFNGDGTSEIGSFYRGEWFIDLNGNGVWDESDMWAKLGDELDRPVVGDWDGDGKDDIGIYGPEWFGDQRHITTETGLPDSQNLETGELSNKPKNVPPTKEEATDGQRLLRLRSDGPRRADVIDHVFKYGDEADLPVAGDWNGDGIRSVGVFRGGRWKLDVDGDGLVETNDAGVMFGKPGDIPLVGDWDGNGVEEIGVYRSGTWILDVNGNRELDAHDRVFEMGGRGDRPIVGDWDGDGKDDPGLYRELPLQEL